MPKILCVGAGHMGRSHALAYHAIPDFEMVGICTRSAESRERLNQELGGHYPLYSDFDEALKSSGAEAVSISTYPDTHHRFAMAALEAGCDVFIEKPLAENVAEAEALVACARRLGRKLVVGYILRHHPTWMKFIEMSRQLGKPLVMRMNLNQQSSGSAWETHKALMQSLPPIVDCGVHYVDVMCQMTRSRPVRVSAIGARLSDEIPPGMMNYGQLQITFEDGSVAWYEAGWGPMMSQSAYFIKDVIGPNGSVSIEAREAASDEVEAHTSTHRLRYHRAERDAKGGFSHPDQWIANEDEPDHDALCHREQVYFLRAIQEQLPLDQHWEDVLNSMRIVAAAESSIRRGRTIEL